MDYCKELFWKFLWIDWFSYIIDTLRKKVEIRLKILSWASECMVLVYPIKYKFWSFSQYIWIDFRIAILLRYQNDTFLIYRYDKKGSRPNDHPCSPFPTECVFDRKMNSNPTQPIIDTIILSLACPFSGIQFTDNDSKDALTLNFPIRVPTNTKRQRHDLLISCFLVILTAPVVLTITIKSRLHVL